MKNLRYDVRTSVKDATIQQTVDLIVEEGDMEAKDRIMTQVVNTQETQTRAALVHLGWTPPGANPLFEIVQDTEYMLRGMALDPAIPSHTKSALWVRIAKLVEALKK